MTNGLKSPCRHSLEMQGLVAEIAALQAVQPVGRIDEISGNTLIVSGLSSVAGLGDQVQIRNRKGARVSGEILQMNSRLITVMPDEILEGAAIGDEVVLLGPTIIAPDNGWIGHVIDPSGRAIDGSFLMRGVEERSLREAPPKATERRGFGGRLETGMAAFNTMLPIVRGQRIGLFSGSGVGKSTLLARLACGMQADIVIIALIGERGREVREFVDNVLGPEGMAKSVVVAATSDQSPLVRRRCALTAMSVAEHFRDQGLHVLLLADSVTRFAEAHREVALASGEQASLRGFPPSTSHTIMALCERAGPGVGSAGDITAIFSVLVAGSDMDEPIADILRGVLDGHVVLDRQIAERGRFPAIDFLRSVSRSLPEAASAEENTLITAARHLLGAYDRSEMMIQAGLYAAGSDPAVDEAIRVYPLLEGFLSEDEAGDCSDSFTRLRAAVSPENA